MFGISYDAKFKEISQIAVQPHTECGRRQVPSILQDVRQHKIKVREILKHK